MGIVNEAAAAPGQLQAALAAGLASISSNQTVSFQQYTKSTLPTDGYVFWVATGTTQQFTGSLHLFSDRHQDEDQTISVNKVVFTAPEEITQLNAVAPGTMWVGTWATDSVSLQVAFAERGAFYEQSGLWHYAGFAVYPALSAQLVASIADLPVEPIVSNSLPIWLSQNSFAPVYPSFLVPDNVIPPYVVAHVEPLGTAALGAFPVYTWPTNPVSGLNQLSSSQLMKDSVRLTLYGFTNQTAIQYFASLIDYSLNTDDFGFCNSPAVQDDKRTQVEIGAVAMKKTIAIEASYYQSTADAVAR
ncbi:MAG: hypothetical protein G3I10_07400, partial [Ferrovum sp.]|nr:hypothetical protein [Ferrovum sp.]